MTRVLAFGAFDPLHEVREKLEEKGKYQVKIVRLQPFKPELYPPD